MSDTRPCGSCGEPVASAAAWCSSCGKPQTGTQSDDVGQGSVPLRLVEAGPKTREDPSLSGPIASLPYDFPDTVAAEERPGNDSGESMGTGGVSADAEVLKTGMWRTFGSSLDADIRVGDVAVAPRGVRLRRVGTSVEIEVVEAGVDVRVDGKPTNREIVDLQDQHVEVDGVRLTDDMVPQDTIDLDQVPDYFAPILMGRAPDCDFVINDDDAVSGRHAGLSRQDGYLLLEDLESVNGTWVDDRRIKRMRLGWRQPFEVGSTTLTAVEVVSDVRMSRLSQSTSVLSALQDSDLDALASRLGPGTDAAVFDFAAGQNLIVGRDPNADVVLDTPNVSRLHARLTREDDGIRVEDLGSTNGTWVNGRRIREATLVQPGDDLRFGPQRLQLTADGKVRTQANKGQVAGVRLDASKLVRTVGPAKKPLTVIDGVSFSILPGEMVAIMGPSGAGKTSVLTTLAGYTPPSSGHVYMDGLSLYHHYDVFRSAIGYVPQEDVMHRSLTVREVLRYQARLRFPSEVGADEIEDRITTVLRQLDLEKQADSIVGDAVHRGLSGGQRRRLNVGMELLMEPSLLLLDEPTSGLDARSAMQLIRQCRGLASAGRTVVLTIHQPRREAFDLFDKLLLLTKGGKLAYFGPTHEAKRFFSSRSEVAAESARNPADYVLDALDPMEPSLGKPPSFWRREFRRSALYGRFVQSRLSREEREHDREVSSGRRPRQSKANPIRQLGDLTRRYALLKWRDRQALAVQMVQAPIIGFLAVLLFFKGRYSPLMLEDDITPTLFVVMAAAVWFGCSNVAREIVGEAAIFRRERMGRLRSGPYLLSKLLVQGALIAVQVGMLLAILIPAIPLQGGVLRLFGVGLLAGWSAMALGLLVSTIARTELQAIQYVPLVILPQIMLSGVLLPVAGAKATPVAVWLSKPILLRWAYSAALHVELAKTTLRGEKALYGARGAEPGYGWRNGFVGDSLTEDVLVMGGLGLACVALTWFLLARRDRR